MDQNTTPTRELTKNEKLRAYIEKMHIKQSGLAKELGISAANFNVKLFGVSHHFKPEEYEKLESFLGIKIDEL